MPTISVIIPAYNESESIKRTVEEIKKKAGDFDYIVINDEVENAVDKIIAIIRAEHAKCERALEGYYKLMEE